MSNPSVTATISANDKASPALRQLLELTQKLSQTAKAAFSESQGGTYTNQFRQATSAATQHLSVLEKIHKAHAAIGATVAGVAGAKAFQFAKSAVGNYIPYERDVRYQKAIQSFSDKEMATLERQRVNAATIYGVKPEETLHAQQAFVTRGFNAAVTEAATQQALILSRALAVNGETASKIVEGITFGSGQHPHTAAEATRLMGRNIDMAALAAKAGAMSPEDISQFAKFGMGMTTAAGISAQQSYATAMTLKRANVGGDESGVFMRQMAARLMAPTRGAFDAFAQMGIDYDKYASQGNVSVEAMDAAFQRRYGKGIGAAGRASLEEAFGDEKRNVLGDRKEFAMAIREAIEKGGEGLSKIDQKNVVATALRQYDLAKGGLQGGALFDEILSKASPKQMQAIIGDKQGGRAVMLLNALDQYREYLEKLKHGDGYAEKIAQERMQGLAAAADRLSASLDTAQKQLVKANEGWLTPMADAGAKVAGFTASLSDGQKQAVSVAAGLASLSGLAAAGSTIASVLTSFTGLAASANVASAALVRVATGGAVGTATAAAGGAAAVATGSRLAAGLGVASKTLGWGAIIAGTTPLIYGLTNDEAQGVTRDRTRARTAREAIRADAQARMDRVLAIGGGTEFEDLLTSPDPFSRYQPRDPWAARRGSTNAFLRQLGASEDGPQSRGWQDSAFSLKPSQGLNGANITGTVNGAAELHINLQGEVRPTAYLEGIIHRAESAANISLNGRLGTSMQGPGDNATKPTAPNMGAH